MCFLSAPGINTFTIIVLQDAYGVPENKVNDPPLHASAMKAIRLNAQNAEPFLTLWRPCQPKRKQNTQTQNKKKKKIYQPIPGISEFPYDGV
jgi:hypothetical protein